MWLWSLGLQTPDLDTRPRSFQAHKVLPTQSPTAKDYEQFHAHISFSTTNISIPLSRSLLSEMEVQEKTLQKLQHLVWGVKSSFPLHSIPLLPLSVLALHCILVSCSSSFHLGCFWSFPVKNHELGYSWIAMKHVSFFSFLKPKFPF